MTDEVRVPSCCPSLEDYIIWVHADTTAQNRDRFANKNPSLFCTDCTETYAASMRLSGKCDHPEVIFSRNNGELIGHLPSQQVRRSQYRGVSWSTRRQMWFAQFGGFGIRNKFLGYFNDELDAKIAHDKFREKAEKEYATADSRH